MQQKIILYDFFKKKIDDFIKLLLLKNAIIRAGSMLLMMQIYSRLYLYSYEKQKH